MNRNKQIFLFFAHFGSKAVIKEYERIEKACRDLGDTVWLYHSPSKEIPLWLQDCNHYSFTDAALKLLDYPMIGESIIPGHAHFPVMQFFRENPDYEHYWVIEYDVRFSGNWYDFFSCFKSDRSDLISCHINHYGSQSKWAWWGLDHPVESIKKTERLRSFNTIYRISSPALSFLHDSMKSGWRGHFETLIPTLLHHNGFKLLDMGGNGPFTPTEMIDKFYTYSAPNKYGVLKSGTMRYRPPFLQAGKEANKLYHPVKSLQSIAKTQFSLFKKMLTMRPDRIIGNLKRRLAERRA